MDEMDLYQQIFFTTISLVFGLLHLFLYLYNRQLKSNLYFSIFVFFYALNIFFDFQVFLVPDGPEKLIYLRIHRGVLPFNPIFALLFLYSIFDMKVQKHFWIISAGLIITGIFAVIDPINNFYNLQIFLIIFSVEASRLAILVILNKKDGAFLIGIGYALLFLFSIYDFLLDFEIILPYQKIHNGYPFGFVCLMLANSIYLSRDYAKINKKIITQEIQATEMKLKQKLLEKEDERKSKELEDARNLQLSMLPSCEKMLCGLEICFSMKTATEVGGDYYDYSISKDGVLTLALGDATGHGMKAGILVSIIKSLFLTQVHQQNIPDFFNTCSQAIKKMNLGNLYMALMIMKIRNNEMTVSSAGIPPFYIFRKKTNSIEEFVIKGMPLGAFDEFEYKTEHIKLDHGDVVLFMSDGFPELFNPENEVLDNDRIKEIFMEAINKPPHEIVEHLYIAGDKWRIGRSQEDDITFIVFKYP